MNNEVYHDDDDADAEYDDDADAEYDDEDDADAATAGAAWTKVKRMKSITTTTSTAPSIGNC